MLSVSARSLSGAAHPGAAKRYSSFEVDKKYGLPRVHRNVVMWNGQEVQVSGVGTKYGLSEVDEKYRYLA